MLESHFDFPPERMLMHMETSYAVPRNKCVKSESSYLCLIRVACDGATLLSFIINESVTQEKNRGVADEILETAIATLGH